ncbi:MAG TPA: HEAT repeat domain-containing protein [Tepidisphaeraceae bacterium]|nr:HEAT repeat domain-containing protein [Tepidisphaeraceae bacterium]
MRVAVRLLLLGGLVLTGCFAQGGPNPPVPGEFSGISPGTGPIANGPVRIDDDSGSQGAVSAVGAVLLAPIDLTGDLIAIPVSAMKMAEGDTAGKAARMTLDKQSADNRRQGVTKLVDYGFAKRPPYTTHYEQMAETDSDPTVRAAALRACNRARDRKATPVFITALGDKSPLVQLEAAKGLANLPDPNAADALLRVISNPESDRDVRIAAVDAIRYYRRLDVARALSNLLADHDFSVAWQARRSLVFLTRQDFGYNEGAWLGFLAGPEKPLG